VTGSLTRQAPAKINLYLRVLGRRPDGDHEIDSLMLPLELADSVEIHVDLDAPAGLECLCPGCPELEGPDNLAARAARALVSVRGSRARIRITVHKRIWIAAGLGGGSSDAAATLLALGELVGAEPAEVCAIAPGLGADVPFFLEGGSARARGRGELLTRVGPLPPLDLVLVNPGRPLATAAVYQALDALAPPAPRVELGPLGALTRERLVDLIELVGNDLGRAARALCPEIDELHRLLASAGALASSLSGSGPTVFGVFADAELARTAGRAIAGHAGLRVEVTRTAA